MYLLDSRKRAGEGLDRRGADRGGDLTASRLRGVF